MTKNEEIINKLNSEVKIRVAPSKVHGVGILAMRDIAKGQKLNAGGFPRAYKIPLGSMDKLFPDVKQIILERWPSVIMGSGFMWPDSNYLAYMNHSDKANYDAQNDVMTEDVKTGEEIFENYRKIPGHEIVFPWLVDK